MHLRSYNDRVPMPLQKYLLCNNEEETIDRLFFNCSTKGNNWEMITGNGVMINSKEALICQGQPLICIRRENITRNSGIIEGFTKALNCLILGCMVWHIWNEHNRCFK